MNLHRLRAPSTDGALLAEPALSEAGGLLAANAARLAQWDLDLQGRPVSWLRPAVREQVLEKARAYLKAAGLDVPERSKTDKLVVTGHQPELFHPGVWVKNFAASAIAGQVGGLGLNLIVDNDIPKSAVLKVPHSENGGLRVERVAFDEWAGEIPYEDMVVGDESLFESFADRVRHVLPGSVTDPVLDEFWPHATGFRSVTDRVGMRFAMARRAVEASWGAHNLEVPLSQVCETEGFLWFASHLLAHLPRFQQIHNEALRDYRAVYGIRSRHHPVPALGGQGDWLEAPFWVWRAGEPRRRPLLARQQGRTMALRIAGEEETLLELPLSADREACCAVERLQTLPALGVRLRTRALTTTMFARYFLGDLFLHGIGGAKYDELGDAISGRFYGLEPPGYLTMSMTLWLGLGDDPIASERLSTVERRLRDLTFNPDRHLDGPIDPETARKIESKRKAVNGPVGTHKERVARFREIRRCNETLQDLIAGKRDAIRRERDALVSIVQRNEVARSREYASVLHSRFKLRAALVKALPGLSLTSH